MAQIAHKVSGKQGFPRVVAQVHNPPPGVAQLHEKVVLLNSGARKATTHVDKRRQRTCCQTLQPLQRSRRRIGDKRPQKGISRRLQRSIVHKWERIVKSLVIPHRNRKVVAQRVNDQHHRALERPRVPTSTVRRALPLPLWQYIHRPARVERRRRGTARLLIEHQPRQEKSAREIRNAHGVDAQHPDPKARGPRPAALVIFPPHSLQGCALPLSQAGAFPCSFVFLLADAVIASRVFGFLCSLRRGKLRLDGLVFRLGLGRGFPLGRRARRGHRGGRDRGEATVAWRFREGGRRRRWEIRSKESNKTQSK
ncbi:hypothetical protein B0T14DRAFT_514853 [Immersiella caudata]|uniref:Uncharacterized protein n=1 Tax=Immersiella caudata TaxID=314043 RepID=A0AA40C2G9_9PEZI|nr:hypothetical protein B0T14DRAFT_514853 [Immersiella caudata]